MRRAPFPTLQDRYAANAPHGRLSATQQAQMTLRTRSHIANGRRQTYFTNDGTEKVVPRVADHSPRRTPKNPNTPTERTVVEW